jgi:hypothetical protein
VRFSTMARRVPGRLVTGAFILNSGLSKWEVDEETAAHMHGMAVGAYPFLASMKPKDFARLLSASEIALGTALLLPIVPAGLAGLGLTAFSGGLVGLYARTPGMTKEGSLLPTQQGIALAKDAWMLGIGLSLVLDEITERGRRDDG